MSDAQPKSKRKRRTKEEVRRDLSGNYLESSSYVDSIQKSMARPADDDACVSEHWEHSTSRQDSAQASSLISSELHVPTEPQDNSSDKDPFNVFATAISMENFETDQTHESSLLPNFESTISSSPEENSSDYENAWLNDYFAKIQDALHEELTHVEQEFNTAEEETTGDAFDMSIPDFACFTQDKKEDEENLDERALYPGAAITVGLSALLIMTFALRHMLSGEALSDMLTLISAHCLSPNLCMKSIFELKKHFHNLKAPMRFHRYCSYCFLQVEGNLNVCPNSFCSRDLTRSENTSFFIEIPIASQIRDFFARPGFLQLLEHRFIRIKKDSDNIEDIYDGELYKRHTGSNGILSDVKNISLMWNTDGIPVFKSSKFALWPLYLVINELPYKDRISRDNMIFAGLWFGSSKPVMLTFLQPFHSALSNLENEGLLVETFDDQHFTTRAILLAGTCDLPAKCLVCNTVQYNGFYGCSKCKQPGQTVKTGKKGGHTHAFAFDFANPKGPKRTQKETLEESRQATSQRKPVNGIKGPSWLSGLKHHDIIDGTGIDYMHCVLLGICKRLLGLWFDSGETADYKINSRISTVDARLATIKPPNNISRVPRSIENHRKYFKASELRSFLLFYGPAVLYDVLPKPYYEHFLLLSEAVFILLQESISEQQLEHAERLLFHFCILFEGYYGLRYQTANIHLLVHLVDDVRLLGPLWTHSCFHFEDKNGFLLKTFHGTQNIQFQIISAVSISKKLPELRRKFLPEEGLINDFYRNMVSSKRSSNGIELCEGYFALGATSERRLSELEIQALGDFLGSAHPSPVVNSFKRMRSANNGILHSRSYERVRCRNSFTVRVRTRENTQEYGHIEFFFQTKPICFCLSATTCDCSVHNLALLTRLRRRVAAKLIDDKNTNASCSHVSVVAAAQADDIIVVNINQIESKCVFICVNDTSNISFVVDFPNTVETD